MADLIERQVVIEAIENIDCSDGVGISTLKCEAIDDAVTAIKALPSVQPDKEALDDAYAHGYTYAESKYREMLSAQLEGKKPRWIPVAPETLPEHNRVVIAYTGKGTWDYGMYRGHMSDIHDWNWKHNTVKYVLYWMYKEDALPSPFAHGFR